MTFFSEAKQDGTIDHKIEMSQQEFEMMLRGMLEDSSAWNLHKNKHKGAQVAPIFKDQDLSEFEQNVNKHSRKDKFEEPSIIQYDSHTKMFVAGCNCGEKFKIDVKNDKVEHDDPSLKMKELNPYNKNQGKDEYGREQNTDNGYESRPEKRSAISYNNNSQARTQYKE